MHLSMRYFFFVLTLLLVVSGLQAQTAERASDYGLAFASHEVTMDQRTSLNLTPNAPITLKKGFEIKFSLSLRRLKNAYGYVLRIIANDSLNIDLVSSPDHNDFYDF